MSSKPNLAVSSQVLAESLQVTREVPVLRPKLPEMRELAPYIKVIDEKRLYSNGGPLSLKLQAEMARHIGCAEDTLIMAASATSGITAALLALDLPENSVCLMPSWTFAATPHAALAAGLQPFFLDVELRTWALSPARVKASLPENARALIVVSPFGAPTDITAWQNFQNETGIHVVVDAAAGFDTVRFSSLTSVVSLHATKLFAAGEGGLVVAPTAAMRDRIRACSNFGFDGTRSAKYRAVNSKLSEYHSAVALANFDRWPATRLQHLQIAGWYRQALKLIPHVSLQPGYGEDWACGNTNIVMESDSAESIALYMAREGIETRKWWGDGCHVQPAFQNFARTDLRVTEYLGMHTIGLPHFVDMEKADVTAVAAALSRALTSRAGGRRRA